MKRLISLVLCLVILSGCAEKNRMEASAQGLKKLLGVQGRLLSQSQLLPAGNSQSDWLAMALALGNIDAGQADYLAALEDYVTKCYETKGTLDARKATEYHRIALTVQALGGDPTAFGTHPDGSPIDLIADGTYHYAGLLGDQGLNGPIFALITLDSGAFGTVEFRQLLVDEILSAQESTGGFGLLKGSSEVDITAMALQALAPYRAAHQSEIDTALGYLADQMTPRCTFDTYGESAESVCQVIIALCALGIDPAADARFCRGDATLLTALESYRLPDGTYRHTTTDETGNLMATEQAMLALLALERLPAGKSLYDFTGK